ncbi:unnamed protein product [Effrenium voratum]|nr:unnamed protein product [Effrenium voratum]|mmetsp:Transcript_98528/g.234624  ORF Transcript_98528/g.234624 Transcript_98528/m.234624 type:complete len:1770 (+) Transcript_98528:58-5367(+)
MGRIGRSPSRRKAWLLLYLILWSDYGVSAIRDAYNDLDNELTDEASDQLEGEASQDLAPEGASVLQTVFRQEAQSGSVTSSQLAARAQLQAATARLQSSTKALVELLQSDEALELVDLLQSTEATSREFNNTPKEKRLKDKNLTDHALNVSRKMYDVLQEVRSSDTAMRQSLARTGDPLVYDDGQNISNSTDPGQQVGELAESIARLANRRGDKKLLRKTEDKLLEHTFAVQKLVNGVQEAGELGSDAREVLDDTEDPNATLVSDLAESAVTTADTGGNESDSPENWEVDELDVEKMDGFTRAKLCDLLPSLDCEACGANSSSLQEYRDCVSEEVMRYQKQQKRDKMEAMQKRKMDQTIENEKRLKNMKKSALLGAHDMLQIWGVGRNWARWTSDPAWPLETLKGEPAKAGWEAFTTDSQAIVEAHAQEFQTEAVAIAKEEAAASGDTIYAAHLEHHVTEAESIKAGAEELVADGMELKGGGEEILTETTGSISEAQAIQAESVQLQSEMKSTSEALGVELDKCSQPFDPVSGSSCNPDEVARLTDEMNGHRAQTEELAERSEALGEDLEMQSEEAKKLAQDAEQVAVDAEELKTQAMTLKEEAYNELTSSETLNAIATEAKECAQRIASRVLDLAVQTVQSMTEQILMLVPDLFFACLEAALDIITGFGWIITAARLSWKLVKFAWKKWKQYRDNREQKLCGKAPQLDCCVDSVMSWYDNQVLAQRTSAAQFQADTQSVLAKSFKSPTACTPWTTTLYAGRPDNETLKILVAREMSSVGSLIYKRPINIYSRFGLGILRSKTAVTLIVARSSLQVEYNTSRKKPRVLRFSTGCEDFLPFGTARDTKGLRAIKNKRSPLGVWFRFGKGTFKQRTFEMASYNESFCEVAHAMCRAACHQPEKCDDYLDPEVEVDLKSKAAKAHEENLLPLCVPVSGLARANGVKEPTASHPKETLGPTAMRPFVWHHLFKEGQEEAMPRTEAYAYSAALCDKHVLPFWTCGVEECSLCQGVASMYSSSQSSAKWCSAFKLETIDNTTDSYARDLGRFYKCNYLTNYLSSTEDKHRLENREATTEEACTSRTFCSDTVNKLPKLDMRPGLQKESDQFKDSQCRLCLEFVQRAAAGLRPKGFCKAIPKMYGQQKIFCEGTLNDMMEAYPGIKLAQNRSIISGWLGSWSSNISGNTCNEYCQGWVRRNPAARETLKNPSPLLLAGEDSEPAPPGKVAENWQETAPSITKSPWIEKAMKSVSARLPVQVVSGPNVVLWKIQEKVQKAVTSWEALLKELAWDGTFTQKRVWPRTGTPGLLSKKVQQAVFLMMKEGTFLRTHINFISDIMETKLNLNVARKTAEDLTRRIDLLVQNFDAMSEVLKTISMTKAPSKLRKAVQKKAKDTETVVQCYAVVVARHETYMPILSELSKSLRDATDKLMQARQRGIKYSPKETGLLDVLSKFYLVLPKEEQTRFTRLKQWLNPFNLFRTQLRIDKLVKKDSKDCSFKKVRRMTQSGLWKEFQTCCTERSKQVLGWEMNIRNVHTQINKILDMMGYVKGNFVTRNIRKAFRFARDTLLGISRKRGIWIEEEAADMLDGTAKDFQKALNEENTQNNKRGAVFQQLTEDMYNSVGDRGVRRGFFKELRFDVVKRNALKELKNGKDQFMAIRKLLTRLSGRIAVKEEFFNEVSAGGDSADTLPRISFEIVDHGHCEDKPRRRKASAVECESASPGIGLRFKGGSFFYKSTPAGCLSYPAAKSYFKDSPTGGECGYDKINCICAIES